jgi:hypothetical protein
MRAEEKHGAVGVKNILGAVTVMHIPIRNEHFSESMLALRIAGRDGNVIKNAEAHALVGTSMVPRRPHNAKGVLNRAALNRALDHRVNGVQDAARCIERDIPGAGRHRRIPGTELLRAGADLQMDLFDVAVAVASRELVFGGRTGIDA